MWENTKELNTNVTKCKKTKHKYDNIQNDKIQVLCDITQKDTKQIWQNTTKY